jgi:hypothetical protein
MAQAPGHRLGQIIGDTLELAIGPPLQAFANMASTSTAKASVLPDDGRVPRLGIDIYYGEV